VPVPAWRHSADRLMPRPDGLSPYLHWSDGTLNSERRARIPCEPCCRNNDYVVRGIHGFRKKSQTERR